MSIKKNVFGSLAEQQNFYKLSRTWGDKYRIYHNLPFLNVFSVDDLPDFSDSSLTRRLSLSEIDLSRLKKTSVDFTLCDENDTPLLCVEFDGWQEGFNLGQTYYPTRKSPTSGSWRQAIMELKLKVADLSVFPFVVVASDHFKDLSSDVKLTIVDGIIGDILSAKDAQKRIYKGFDPAKVGYTEEEFAKLSKTEQYEVLQDWVIYTEIDADFDNNPIVRKRAELETSLGISGYSLQYFCYPSLDTAKTKEERAALMANAIYNGVRIKMKTDDLGDVEGTAMIPNFKNIPFTGVLAEEIAAIYALEQIRKLRASKARKQSKKS